MKKITSLRLAGLLLILTLITSSFVGSTFAKYVTEASGTDTARVAHWGVKIDNGAATLSTENLFSSNYVSDTGVVENGVTSNNEDNVIAPGTKGSFTFEVDGKPETAFKLSIVVTAGYTGQWYGDAALTPYHPVIFLLDDVVVPASGGAAEGSLEALVAAVEALAGSTNYAPNTDLGVEIGSHTISWIWPFDGDDELDELGGEKGFAITGQTDEKDTYLGDIAASDSAIDKPKVSFTLEIKVEQID